MLPIAELFKYTALAINNLIGSGIYREAPVWIKNFEKQAPKVITCEYCRKHNLMSQVYFDRREFRDGNLALISFIGQCPICDIIYASLGSVHPVSLDGDIK